MATVSSDTSAKTAATGRFLAAFFEKFWLPLAGLALDAGLLTAAFYCAWLLRFRFGPVLALIPPPEMQDFSATSAILPAIIPLWLLVFYYSAKLYDGADVPAEDVFVRALHGCVLGAVLALALSFLLKNFSQSRLLYVFALPLSTLFVFAGNVLLRALQRLALENCGWKKRMLVVGGGKPAELARAALARAACRMAINAAESTKDGLLSLVREHSINHVLLANASFNKSEIVEIADRLELEGVELSIIPGIVELRTGEVQLDTSLGIPVIKIYHTSFSGSNYWTKRLFDLGFCALVFLLGAVPFLLVVLLIKLDSRGPAFYRQKRVGRNGRVFEIYKFRTMTADAETRLGEITHLNERDGNVFKMKNDPRVTRAGRWLRRPSVDEFPQLLNVVRGEMSVIGPRPPTVGEYEKYDEVSKKRLHVLPGITGLWQVSGRADLDFEQMLALDFYYIEHWSLGLDLLITLKTPFAMVSSKGAY